MQVSSVWENGNQFVQATAAIQESEFELVQHQPYSPHMTHTDYHDYYL